MRGGGQRSLHLLIKYLNRDRFQPFLVVPKEDELSEEAARLGVKTFILPFPRIRTINAASPASSLVRLWRIVRENRIDLIHTESPREAFYAVLVKKVSGVRVIFHARVSDSHVLGDRLLYYLTDRLIAVSGTAARRFRDRKNKVAIIFNGVELDAFRPSDRCENNGPLQIGYFGQIQRRKGIDALLGAMRSINREVELTVMGDGDPEYLEELGAMSGGVSVTYKNYRPNILDDMSAVDTVVLPAMKEEGLSRMIIESMAMGKVVIATDLMSSREAMGEELKEFMFPAGDHEKLAAIIRKVSDDRRILCSMREKTRGRAEQLFDVRKNTGMIEGIYDSLLS